MKKKLFLFLLFVFTLGLAVSCNNPQETTEEEDFTPREMSNEQFDDYLNEIMYVFYLGEDASNWNTLAVHPENYGYEREEEYIPQWYSYDYDSLYDNDYAYNKVVQTIAELESFDYDKLTDIQKKSYDIVYFSMCKEYEYYDPANEFEYILDVSYIDQFGGYVDNFTSLLENYIVRNEQDVLDMISYTKSVPEAFDSYIQYCQDRADLGYALNDYTINEMIDYLETIEADGEEYYLFKYLPTKIADAKLDSEFTEAKTAELLDELKNSFLPAIAKLADDLEQFIGLLSDDELGYWGVYGEKGQKLYKWNTEKLLGYSNLNMDDYIKAVNLAMNKYKAEYKAADAGYDKLNNAEKSKYASLYNSQAALFDDCTPDEIIVYLKNFAKTIVPDLETDPTITFKYMDDNIASRTTTVAYYTLSPFDDYENERITLNPKALKNINDNYVTIAHEGYPGHLFSYVYRKQNNFNPLALIADCTGFGEGWATYVERMLMNYAVEDGSEGEKLFVKYQNAWDAYAYLLQLRIDIGINYEGWDLKEVSRYMTRQGLNAGAAEGLYYQLLEMPCVYSTYGYGRDLFINIHDEAKTALGDSYNEVEFNDFIISLGECQLEKLEKEVDSYIASHLAN